jgi:hypothetical protein
MNKARESEVLVVCDPAASRIVLPSEVFAYADEQGSSNPKPGAEFSIGIVFGAYPIGSEMILEAVERCPPRHKCERTDAFHASKNCEPCRDALGSVIRDRMTQMFFTSVRWRFPVDRSSEPKRGELHRHALTLALTQIGQVERVRHIRLFYAKIKGVSEESLTKWCKDEVKTGLDVMMQQDGKIVHCFVEIVPREGSSNEPGIQIVDRVLWQEGRCRGGVADLASLGLYLTRELRIDNFTLRRYAGEGTDLAARRSRPTENESYSLEEIFAALLEIEQTIHRIALDAPAALKHVMGRIARASRSLKDRPTVETKDFRAMCRAYLLIVDTLPLYGLDEEQMRCCGRMAMIAAAIASEKDAWTVTAVDRWLDRREGMFQNGNGPLFSSHSEQ